MLVALCLVFGTVETLQQHLGNIARGDSASLFQTAQYNLLPWLPVLPLLPVIVLLAERWPMDQGRWKSRITSGRPICTSRLAPGIKWKAGNNL